VTPVLCDWEPEIEPYLAELSEKSSLPIIIYNTETIKITDVTVLKTLESSWKIIGIKDSSGNKDFFRSMIVEKEKWALKMDIFQWMENELHTSLDADWFLISLVNGEPELCRNYLQTWDMALLEEIKNKWSKYNLWWNWYITLKAILMMRGLISSAEEVDALWF